ncbi:MAG: RimK family alpha-L-glutamate ligase [Pirellulales bacterium]
MRLAVLCSPESWYLSDLRRAAAGRHEIVVVAYPQIAAYVRGVTNVNGTASVDRSGGGAVRRTQVRCSGVPLDEFDVVLVRTMPQGSLEQVVFRMDALARLEAAGRPIVNSPRSIEIAVDKFLASALLVEAGLDHPETVVCQTVDEAMQAFAALGGDVVVKPLFGAEGRGIARVSDEAIALRVFKSLVPLGSVLYLQRFVPHDGYDIRAFVLGERTFGMKRVSATDWRTNVSRGATTEPFALDAEMVDFARRAAAATGATMAGVDILIGRDGRCYVIEVNAVPGWQALSRTLGVDVAAIVLEELSRRAAEQRPY